MRKSVIITLLAVLLAPVWAMAQGGAGITNGNPQFDGSGNLKINCLLGCSASAGFSDNSAFTVGTSAINVIGGYFTSGADPTLSTGNAGRARIDAHSYLYTDCVIGCAGGSFNNNSDAVATSATNGQSASWLYAFNGTTYDRLRDDGSFNLKVNCAVGCSGGATTPTDAFTNPTTAGLQFDLLAGFNGTTWDRLRSTITNGLQVDVTRVQGTVAATQSTSPWVDNITQVASVALGGTAVVNYGSTPAAVAVPAVNAFITNTVPVTLTSTTITGTVGVTQSTSPWVDTGNLTDNNAVPSANNLGVLPCRADTNTRAVTVTDQVLLSCDANDLLRVSLKDTPSNTNNLNVNLAASAATVTVSGTVTANAGTGQFNVTCTAANCPINAAQWGGTNLGTPTNFGTTPGAVIAGSVNSSCFISTTACVAAAAGIQKVGISGNAGATLDAASNGAQPTNQLWVVNSVSTAATAAVAAPFWTAALTTAQTVKSGAGNVYGWSGYNPNASLCVLDFYNTTTPTLGTTTPIFSLPLTATATANFQMMYPVNFGTAIAVAAETADKGASTCGTGLVVSVFFE